MNPYEKLLNRKRKWTPVQTTKGKLKYGAEETVYRALAVRNMECPVGAFVSDSLSEIPEKSRELLESNIKDEDNHDLALGYIANALGVDDKAEAEALRLRDAWIEHPDHTILKASVIESSIVENINGKDPKIAILNHDKAVNKNACCKFNFLS